MLTTQSDFRFFFSCSISRSNFQKCPWWWPVPTAVDHSNSSLRFHEVILREVQELSSCLASDDGAVRRSRGYDRATVLDAISNPRNGSSLLASLVQPHKAMRGRTSWPLLHKLAAVPRESTVDSSRSIGESRSNAERLLVDDPVRLSECTHRPDLNRDKPLNKCFRSVRGC